jgi:hypothetical protein
MSYARLTEDDNPEIFASKLSSSSPKPNLETTTILNLYGAKADIKTATKSVRWSVNIVDDVQTTSSTTRNRDHEINRPQASTKPPRKKLMKKRKASTEQRYHMSTQEMIDFRLVVADVVLTADSSVRCPQAVCPSRPIEPDHWTCCGCARQWPQGSDLCRVCRRRRCLGCGEKYVLRFPLSSALSLW